MGQYYIVVNLRKQEYLHPHRFGNGLKLMEFGPSPDGIMCGLAVVLADGNGRGGGDLESANPVIGTWAGDPVVVAGDYADEGKHLPPDWQQHWTPDRHARQYTTPYGEHPPTLYAYAQEVYRDISDATVQAMLEDVYLRDSLHKRAQEHKDCFGLANWTLAKSLKSLVT
jgi:hypothetical protein